MQPDNFTGAIFSNNIPDNPDHALADERLVSGLNCQPEVGRIGLSRVGGRKKKMEEMQLRERRAHRVLAFSTSRRLRRSISIGKTGGAFRD